jgi:hypothetical protein
MTRIFRIQHPIPMNRNIKINRLDSSFGPVGKYAGLTLFLVGLFVSYSSYLGLILILLGSFIGFSITCTLIDSERKRVKLSNCLFGIIRTGKWIQVESTMKVGLRESNITWSAFSQGNRPLEITNSDFRLTLMDVNNVEIMELKKFNSFDSAQENQVELANKLGISPI